MRGAVFAMALLLAACSNVVMSTAPSAEPGWRYAAGQRGGQPAVWVCPDTPGRGECRAVDVKVDER